MVTSLIVAYDRKRGIGLKGMLPWHIPADLRLFKRLTWGHHIVMGRRTFESIGRVLPGRTMLVISRQELTLPEGCIRMHSLEDALAYAQQRGETECFIIGGATLYCQALPYVQRIYVSEIDGEFECDVFFPPVNTAEWEERLSYRIVQPVPNIAGFTFRVLERKGLHLPEVPATLIEDIQKQQST